MTLAEPGPPGATGVPQTSCLWSTPRPAALPPTVPVVAPILQYVVCRVAAGRFLNYTVCMSLCGYLHNIVVTAFSWSASRLAVMRLRRAVGVRVGQRGRM